VRQANTIKRDMPIMCVIGNPPYLGEGGVSEGWIGTLMEDYKKEPGGREKLKERNPKWLNDLYVKFIRMSSHLIEKNGEGVLGFITNHGYLDNPTFRGMRWHLLHTFDRIWVLDLHGNAKKKEVTPEGKPDKNVFDIQQGVSIIIAVKKRDGGEGLAEVRHGDLWGARQTKHGVLEAASLTAAIFEKLESPAPHYPFVKRSFELLEGYQKWFSLNDFFLFHTIGTLSKNDAVCIANTASEIEDRVNDLQRLTEADFRQKYSLKSDSRDWRYSLARADMPDRRPAGHFRQLNYRPFDKRWTYWSPSTRGFLAYPKPSLARHIDQGSVSMLFMRQLAALPFFHAFITDELNDQCFLSSRTKEGASVAPLYLYPNEQDLDQTRRVNFDPKLYARLQALATHPAYGTPDEVAVFDYIYGVLHCPAYRSTYAEFLKIDFPRIPWPKTPDAFWDISAKGGTLRQLHLMDPATIGPTPYPFEGQGDGIVDKPRYEDGRVWINATQSFANAPEVSWGFFIGGYQPAQKWLKDRKGRQLGFDDIQHYQRILKILSETDRIMRTIAMDLSEARARD
jgi:hypothetical protein